MLVKLRQMATQLATLAGEEALEIAVITTDGVVIGRQVPTGEEIIWKCAILRFWPWALTMGVALIAAWVWNAGVEEIMALYTNRSLLTSRKIV